MDDYINKASAETTKSSLQLQFQLESTIYPDDPNVTDFLNIYCADPKDVSDKELITSIKKIHNLSEKTAIQYFCVIVNCLLEVMSSREDHTVQLESFRALVIVLHKVKIKLKEKVPRNSLLELYTNYVFKQTPSGKPVYNAICSNFLLYMMDKKDQKIDEVEKDSIFVNSWFFFDLVIKSMILHLEKENKLNQDNRTSLFDDFFARTLSRLLVNLTKYLLFKDHMSASQSISVLNKNLALFMKDLFDVIDRGIVLDMIRSYITKMTDPGLTDDKDIYLCASYKFEFLRIISDHESYVLLNLPFRNVDNLRLVNLTHQYPIAFTVIFEVIQALKTNKSEIWELAIGTLYDTIIKHYYDSRFCDSNRKKIVARIFFVLLPLLLDNWSSISSWKERASVPLKRELYICILYILQSANRDAVTDWWQKEVPHIQVSFIRLLTDITTSFYYDSNQIRPTKTLLTPQVALFMKEIGTEETTNLLKAMVGGEKLDEKKEEKRLRWLTIRVDFLILEILEDFVSVFRAQLLSYAKNVTHQTTGHNAQTASTTNQQQRSATQNTNDDVTSYLFGAVVECYCSLTGNQPNEFFIPAIYIKLFTFIKLYRKIIFRGENNYLRQLLKHVILHCNSYDSFVYIRATTLLFSIFQLNQRTTGEFSQTRIQTIATLSHLVSSREITKDIMLNHSFRRLVYYSLHSYSNLETQMISTKKFPDYDKMEEIMSFFSRNIQEIVLTLSSILRDTLKVAKLPDEGEPHMKMDLYYQISEGYKNAPDLRISWLSDLANLQIKHNNSVEAGMAHLQCAIIIGEHLLASNRIKRSLVPFDIFQSVFPVLQDFYGENSTCDIVLKTKAFTITGFVDSLQTSVKLFIQGEYYEYASQVLKIICPIYEHMQLYRELSDAYALQQDCWSKVNETDKDRLFGKYFRVGFYGNKFGDLNRCEFIYKEPKLTHILDMSERLKTFYSTQTGDEILTLDASKPIDKIDYSKSYMQITHMEPFFQKISSSSTSSLSSSSNNARLSASSSSSTVVPVTFFQKNSNLSHFVFETPFTLSGKAHAEHVSDQYKRKTVLTVNGSFPHLLCRLPVASKYEIIVSPLENAIEDIEKRNRVLENEISSRTPKTLRQVLQGSVRLRKLLYILEY